MTGLKTEWLRLMNMTKIIGDEFPEYIAYQQRLIYTILEDVHSVSSMTELQTAIDGIGTGAGTIFITAGTHIVDTPIDIDGGGSLIIYGHGDNTILEADDGVNVFNITDCASLTIKTLQIDATNYTGATSSVIVNEVNDNVITIEDVSIVGNNLGTGIELVSDNCIIEHCNINNMLDGIYLNNSNRHIIAQNTVSNNARYGININTSLYSSINGNTCNLNLMGIYVLDSTNNSISNNICNQNTEHGIYIFGSSYNTISGNTCENNDSNTANDQAGMYITNNSDFNTITGNSLNNNNNIGLGDGYGLVIATATCEENVVASNNANGNDIDWKDVGARTVIKYYVQSGDELQDAIDSIGTGAGTIVINTGTLTLTATIDVDGGGDYIIEGEGIGSVIDCAANRTAFNITSARSCILRHFKIDTTDITTQTRAVIYIDEASDNRIVIDEITILGVNTNCGRGIDIRSNNVKVRLCDIKYADTGIYGYVSGTTSLLITENVIRNTDFAIDIRRSHNTIISNNLIEDTNYAIYIPDSAYVIVEGNIVKNANGMGIYVVEMGYAFAKYCIINGNILYDCDRGIYLSASNFTFDTSWNVISNNSIYSPNGVAEYGILIGSCKYNIINNNTINGASADGIRLSGGFCQYNQVSNNSITNCGGFGINVAVVGCLNNKLGVNLFFNNTNGDINDLGTGTILFGDDTVYGAGWNGDLGTATKNAIYDELNDNRYTQAEVDALITAALEASFLQIVSLLSGNGATQDAGYIELSASGHRVGCWFPTELDWDDTQDLLIRVPFARRDANADEVQFRLSLSSKMYDASENVTLWDIENFAIVQFPACAQNFGEEYTYTIPAVDWTKGEVIRMQLQLNEAARTIWVGSASISYA